MIVYITLTTAGADTGPFNLYSDVDGYISAFETGVSKAALLAGYTTFVAPPGTTIVRVKSDGVCTSQVDIVITECTTTTTTTLYTDCVCYSALNFGIEVATISWTSCDGIDENSPLNPGDTIYKCARVGTFTSAGSSVAITEGSDPCTDHLDCQPTTTTTTTILCLGYILAGGIGGGTWSAIDCFTLEPVGGPLAQGETVETGCVIASSLSLSNVSTVSDIAC